MSSKVNIDDHVQIGDLSSFKGLVYACLFVFVVVVVVFFFSSVMANSSKEKQNKVMRGKNQQQNQI
jgi:Na+/H+ antiporter NhaC